MGKYGSFQSFHPFLLSLAKFKSFWIFHMRNKLKTSWKHIPKIILIFRASGDLSACELKLKKRTRVRGAVVTCP